jgi:hypothetical protein
VCQPGNTTSACGFGGSACSSCASSCVQGTCIGGFAGGTGTGGNGGSGGRGGGTAGTGGGTAQPQWQGGTRIKVRVLKDTSGASAQLGWKDTQLDEPCWFMAAADGQQRCIPLYSPHAVEGFFADGNCSQPVLLTYDVNCPSAPRHAIRYDSDACPTRAHVFTVGAKLSTTTYYYRSGTSCTMQQAQAGTNVWALGNELAPSELARGTLTPRSGSGIVDIVLTTDDGARGPYGFRDTTGGFDCYALTFGDGTTRCVPSATAYGDDALFADSACTQPGYLGTACGNTQFGVRYVTTGCTSEPSYVRIGSPVTTWYGGPSCTPQPSTTSSQGYAGGAPVPLSSFVAATASKATAGRLERTALTWPGGSSFTSGWRDTQLGQQCQYFYAASDGSRRCLPSSGASMTSIYAESTCTQRLAVASSGCSPAYAFDYFDSCQLRLRVYPVTGAHTGGIYVKSGTGACVSTTSSSTSYFRTGPEVAPATLAPFAEVLE